MTAFTNLLKLRGQDLDAPDWDVQLLNNYTILDFIAAGLLTGNLVSSGCTVTDGGGLSADYADGYVYAAGTFYKITGSSLTLTAGLAGDDAGRINWIYVDSAGTVQVSTTAPSGDYVPLAVVDCGTAAILRIADLRPMSPASEGKVENDCINGTFDIWQRADSQTTSGYGSDDRWLNFNIGSTKTHSKVAFAAGQTDVPGNPANYSRTVVTSVAGSNNSVRKICRIPDVLKYSGKRVCVKFHGKATAIDYISLDAAQNFGTGGSAQVEGISAQKIALFPFFKQDVLFFDLPSVTGKTVGPSSFTEFSFWFDAGSYFDARTDSLGQHSGTFDISEVEIYVSDKELPARRRTTAEELLLCERYYQEKNISYALYTAVSTTVGRTSTIVLAPAMIKTPTVTYSGFGSAGGASGITPAANLSNVAVRVDGSGMVANVSNHLSYNLQMECEL